MAYTIINGLGQLTEFSSYITNNSTTYQFGTAAEALEAYPQFEVVDGFLNETADLSTNVVEYQPALEGGTVAGAEVVSMATAEEGIAATTGAATITSVSVIELVGGILAGLGIGILSYEANKDFWIDVSNNLFINVPGYEPITYDNIEDMSILTLFKGNKTYVSAELVQRMNNYLIELGVYENNTTITYDVPTEPGTYTVSSPDVNMENVMAGIATVHDAIGHHDNDINMCFSQLISALKFYGIPSTARLFTIIYQTNLNEISLRYYDCSDDDIEITFNGSQVTQSNTSLIRRLYGRYVPGLDPIYGADSQDQSIWLGQGSIPGTFYYNLCSINATIVIIPAIEEMPLLVPGLYSTTPDSIPLELPDWWENILEIGAINPSTVTVTDHPYLPVSVPNQSPYTYPVTTPQDDAQRGTTPSTNQEPIDESPSRPYTYDPSPVPDPPGPNPSPTPTPGPAIPVIPTIGGDANALFTAYNPTKTQLNSLGGVLWSSSIIQQIVQMFTNNPLDAIISLHILYATPTTGGNKNIKLGYIDTGIAAKEITNQYVSIDCGTINIAEYFGDARDYAPYSSASLFLPMIGFKDLRIEDCMGCTVHIVYNIDCFTGTVLANLEITKRGVKQILYTYEGNCAVNLPLTGADKSRQLATMTGMIGGAITGNPLMATGAAMSMMSGGMKTDIQRSGTFTGNASAMGCKKPYIVIASSIAAEADSYGSYYGKTANKTVTLSQLSGFTQLKDVHIDQIVCTDSERSELYNLLLSGVIF